MKKVRCPRCFVVNLERFVTFPYCAGCGALLPAEETKALSAFRRPLGVILWTSTIGAALLAIFVAVRVFEAPAAPTEDVSILGRGPRNVIIGDEFVLQLNIDAPEGASPRDPTLRNVKLRVLRDSFETLTLLQVQPPPAEVSNRGRGRYFEYATYDLRDALKMRLRATQIGHQSLQMRFFVGGKLQGVSNFNFEVKARAKSAAQ